MPDVYVKRIEYGPTAKDTVAVLSNEDTLRGVISVECETLDLKGTCRATLRVILHDMRSGR